MTEDEKNLGFTPFADDMIAKTSSLNHMLSSMRNLSLVLDYLRSPPQGQQIKYITITFTDQGGHTRASIHAYENVNPELVNHLRDICSNVLIGDINNSMKAIERLTQELQIAGVDYPKPAGQRGA